ncbi:MAG: endonuclease/exonuclease/phosphatase family protein [Bacteroidales bacterium]|jgi:endonuclease/exonuclease/phosphatase family metal-dependent hydrolase|nr:endonuclease/exonuclease/phosphatase family protein [Bacteroidales bacterium]
MSRRQGKNRMGLISYLIWLLNILFAAALLLSYLSAYINPEITTFFAFLGLGYLFLMLANLLFMLYWLIRGKGKLFLSLVVILMGYASFTKHVQVFPGREAPTEKGFNILSYNVQNMVHSNLGIEKEENRIRIYDFIEKEKSDIVCIQEFANRTGDFEGVFGRMKELTGYPYCYFKSYHPGKTNSIEGLVILSNFPAVHSGVVSTSNGYDIFGQYADILIDTDTIRVYNLHMKSIRLRHEDYKFMDDISRGQTEQAEIRSSSTNIIRKLHTAYQLRARQTLVVEGSLEDCPYPVIICGDFNDTPLSFSYHKISAGLEDAFVKAGHGLGNTYSGNLPPIRIDFIFYSPIFSAYEFNVHKIDLSDHYPVSVWLKKKGEAE